MLFRTALFMTKNINVRSKDYHTTFVPKQNIFMKILVVQLSYCHCTGLKRIVRIALVILWFYCNVYVPFSNLWKQISHWKPLLEFKLMWTNYTKEVIKLPTVVCLTVTCIFVRGRDKIVLNWRLLFRIISLTTKRIIYIFTSQTRRKGTFDALILLIGILLH